MLLAAMAGHLAADERQSPMVLRVLPPVKFRMWIATISIEHSSCGALAQHGPVVQRTLMA
jgi:hypothetical protein